MATESQVTANRRNAESSTGPRTEEGKIRSARNAITFGIYSAADFVPPDETHTYELFCQHFKKDLRPQGPLEQTFAAEIIHAAWRLRRCAVAESQMEPASAPQGDNEMEDPLLTRTQASIDRARAEAQRHLLRAVNELRRLQTERQVRTECLPEHFHTNAIGGLTSIKELKLFLQRIASQGTLKPTESASTKRTQSAVPESHPTPRNAPCPCGSGDKYKRCCGRNAPPVLQQAD
ncbi:MAG TPA: SEC-C domain-containing protein [Bryobacteraceae bacterium]|nr:SEC-C domain-containing protein [Bryobacteraceae bacterium]